MTMTFVLITALALLSPVALILLAIVLVWLWEMLSDPEGRYLLLAMVATIGFYVGVGLLAVWVIYSLVTA